MRTSLGLMYLVGLSTASVCRRIRLPRIIGLLITGIVLGPYALELLDPSILGISAELRQLALVIILIKAGLSLDLSTLRRVGRPAVLLSFLPATFEIAACVLFAPALLGLEDALSGKVALSGLLAVMSVACTVQLRMPPEVDARLSEKFGKVWLATEVALFVLVGAAVDLRYLADAGLPALLLLVIGLIFRSAGTYLSLLGTALDLRERLFPVIAYLPKATVQAAIGGVPLAMGLPCGGLILSVAVLSILVTAPLGAIGIGGRLSAVDHARGMNRCRQRHIRAGNRHKCVVACGRLHGQKSKAHTGGRENNAFLYFLAEMKIRRRGKKRCAPPASIAGGVGMTAQLAE